MSLVARSPLASGALAETWSEGIPFHRKDWRRKVFRSALLQQTLCRIEMLKKFADPTIPFAQFALRFCLSHPAISAVIPGIRNVENAQCDITALAQEKLPQDILDQITHLWDEEFRFNVRTSIGEEGEGERRVFSQYST